MILSTSDHLRHSTFKCASLNLIPVKNESNSETFYYELLYRKNVLINDLIHIIKIICKNQTQRTFSLPELLLMIFNCYIIYMCKRLYSKPMSFYILYITHYRIISFIYWKAQNEALLMKQYVYLFRNASEGQLQNVQVHCIDFLNCINIILGWLLLDLWYSS